MIWPNSLPPDRRPPATRCGHIRRRKLRPVGDVVGRYVKAEIPLFAQFESLGEGEIQIVGSHGANVIKIRWRVSRNERVTAPPFSVPGTAKQLGLEPHRCRTWRALAGIAGHIGPLIEVVIISLHTGEAMGTPLLR